MLRDGTPVLIRAIGPADKDRIREGFEHLSEQSRYRRFLTPVAHLGEEQLRSLTEIDHVDHVAWIAVDPSSPGQPGLGVARYVRLPDEPAVAEAAVIVADSHQGRGLGTLLLGMLALSAGKNGIRTFRAYILAENRELLDVLRDLGAVTAHEDGAVLRVDVAIPEQPELLPDTPAGKVFRAVARRLLPPFHTRFNGFPRA